jgi:hypothetical protein
VIDGLEAEREGVFNFGSLSDTGGVDISALPCAMRSSSTFCRVACSRFARSLNEGPVGGSLDGTLFIARGSEGMGVDDVDRTGIGVETDGCNVGAGEDPGEPARAGGGGEVSMYITSGSEEFNCAGWKGIGLGYCSSGSMSSKFDHVSSRFCSPPSEASRSMSSDSAQSRSLAGGG